MNGSNYKAQLIYSPIASPQVFHPQRYTISLNANPTFVESDDHKHTFTNTGSFFDGFFEYDVPIREHLLFGLWARGTWMKVYGNGELDAQSVAFAGTLGTRFESLSTAGTLSTHSIGGGVAATLTF